MRRACLCAIRSGGAPPYRPCRVASRATLNCPHVQRAQRSARGHWQASAGIPVPERVGLRNAAISQVALSSACCARPNPPPARAQRSVATPTNARRVVFKVLSWLTFFAPAKKVSRPRGRNPRLHCQPTHGRRTAQRSALPASRSRSRSRSRARSKGKARQCTHPAHPHYLQALPTV